MKKVISLLFVVALFIGTPLSLNAQSSVTAHATAEVIMALSATETAQLNFGRFSPEISGGEVKLSPEGVRTATGTVALSGGTYNAAIFVLTGQNNASVSIVIPTAPALLSNSETGKTMQVTDWESYPVAGTNAAVLNNGLLNLNVGATLKVGTRNDNPVGIYSGTYSITFSYN